MENMNIYWFILIILAVVIITGILPLIGFGIVVISAIIAIYALSQDNPELFFQSLIILVAGVIVLGIGFKIQNMIDGIGLLGWLKEIFSVS